MADFGHRAGTSCERNLIRIRRGIPFARRQYECISGESSLELMVIPIFNRFLAYFLTLTAWAEADFRARRARVRPPEAAFGGSRGTAEPGFELWRHRRCPANAGRLEGV